ncbi:MAG: 50S ribosomal protein L6 [Myxococcales bacterium]|nr:MAG: 50S ribosomal protein L6 [Myxococcales bacterium]
MSRIGKLPIPIPAKVDVKIDGQRVTVKGPLGELSHEIRPDVTVKIVDKAVICERKDDAKQSRAYHGLYRALLNNMIHGVSQGFKRELEIIGVGYKAELKGQMILFSLGYSHQIEFKLPKGISADVDTKANRVTVKGCDKQAVGQVAANIRSLRPPEPYKGKGIKYADETIRRKAGKTAGK